MDTPSKQQSNQPKVTVRETTDAKQMKLLQVGIGAFVTVLSAGRLILHYFGNWPVEGYSRKFGYYDETLYWVFFVIGAIWLTLAGISYYRFKMKETKTN